MGVIINGVYYPGEEPRKEVTGSTVSNMHKNHKLRTMAENHAHNLIQPRNQDGTPNQDFIDHFPEDAKNYGFIKDEE